MVRGFWAVARISSDQLHADPLHHGLFKVQPDRRDVRRGHEFIKRRWREKLIEDGVVLTRERNNRSGRDAHAVITPKQHRPLMCL